MSSFRAPSFKQIMQDKPIERKRLNSRFLPWKNGNGKRYGIDCLGILFIKKSLSKNRKQTSMLGLRGRRAWHVLSAYSVPVIALAFCIADIHYPGNSRLIKNMNDSTNYVLAIIHESLYNSNIEHPGQLLCG